MESTNERLPRSVELAARIVANHVRRTETAPEDFADLLQKAYEGIKALVIREGEPSPRAAQGQAAVAEGRRPRGRPRKSAGSGQSTLDLAPRAQATLPPGEDRDTGYIRNGIRSVYPDRLVCLDDGKEVTFLRRHLRKLDVAETDYRTRWDLPADYPMTAPDYVASRKAVARETGFGTIQRPHRETKAGA